jgi:hypothetical protein
MWMQTSQLKKRERFKLVFAKKEAENILDKIKALKLQSKLLKNVVKARFKVLRPI